ncbi:MAG: tRNA 4-thiouridine(8) synthase ThiI [Oscillospiraceae bacterium]|jgi:thiamine biosynthesis protein ThiI|nr:tRNA 4-thiouridine(8) synthase ThiI [Oscillospiraceae bacterium]
MKLNKEILIKFGEIYLKGQNRKKFIEFLVKDIENKLNISKKNYNNIGSIISIFNSDNLGNLVPKIKKIFGISNFALAFKCEKNIEKICEAALEIMKKSSANSFKIEAKRSDKSFHLNSPQICEIVGRFVVENTGLRVDVKKPEIKLQIEIHSTNTYILPKIFPGAGGLPYGVSGNGLILMSGGIDSPVAAFMMAKRGLAISAVHFASPPYTSIRACEKVERILKVLAEYCGQIKLYIVNFTDIQKIIKKTCLDELFTIISRRIMGKISEAIAFKESCKCLITGESLGQVASQTLNAITCTSEAVNLPIFRPLIGMDKNEIILISKKIGTFDISIEPFDDCCSILSPKSPKINPKLKFVKSAENKIENLEDLIEYAVENSEIKNIYL